MNRFILKQIHSLLLKKTKTLAVAESSTGGLLAKLLTDLAGSSKYFILGVIAYSNQAKIKFLKVPAWLILKKGAVSWEVAQEMAERIRKLAKTDFGIGITGIAGPKGGTLNKPVGTVFIAISTQHKTVAKKFHFSGSRSLVRKKAAIESLELLKNLIPNRR